ncbi:ComEC/Rec2 family competence protein [Falsiroseomonas ponticola]|uniref:ComEC/Rec2 family competence protein n=1 Tax=Falsiroseomonas ponticola TaxID=2786951 RepID=UPI001934869D|nr:ComEC/Rec2 family competence protein [Roseomonas ponticola]
MSLALPFAERPGVLARLRVGALELLARQQGRFAPWLAVALGAGVLHYLALEREPAWQPLWLVPPLAGLGFWLARRWLLLGWATGLAAAFLLGLGVAGWHAARQPPPLVLPFGAVVVTGVVAEVQPLPEGRRLVLEQARIGEGEALPRSIRVRMRAEDPARPQPGDVVTLRALVRQPGMPAVPGGWDFQRAAFFSGLGGSGFALGPVAVEPGEAAPLLAGLRAWLDRRVAEAIPGAAGPVAAALLTGTQSAIPEPAMQAMRDSGLAHLLSVSGLHMAIVIGLVFGLLRGAIALVPWLALRVPAKPVAALAALAAGAFYMVLTGSQVPMQRCLGMAALMTVAMLAGRRVLSLRVLAVAAAAVLLVAPAEVAGPSFQMSFAAVLALVAGHEALRQPIARFRAGGVAGPRAWRRVALVGLGLVATSALAGAATAPFGLHHFGRLQVYGIAANALAVPLTSFLIMPAGLVAMLALPLGLEAWPLAVMGWGTEGVLWVARQVAAWPEAAPVMVPLPGWGLGLAAFGFCWLCLWRGGARLLGVPVVAAGLAAGQVTPAPDVLVSPDARIVALRTAEGVFLHRVPGATNFTRDAMLRAFGVTEARPLPESGEAAGGAIACTPSACRFRPRADAGEAVLLRSPPPARGSSPPARGRRADPPDAAALAAACGRAALILALEPVRPRCGQGVTIDRFAMWRDGAQAAWLGTAGARVVSDRAWRGDRPWVPPVPLPGRAEALPLAPLDPGG